jgi:hypothetical protein
LKEILLLPHLWIRRTWNGSISCVIQTSSARPLRCEFALPSVVCGAVERRRLAVEPSSGLATLNGAPMQTDGFPRFENQYVVGNSGGSVEWGAPSYEIRHGPAGRFLRHDLSAATRVHD